MFDATRMSFGRLILKLIKTILPLGWLIASSAYAIVIRHDVEDKQYLALGEEYSQSVAYIGGCAATLVDVNWVLTAAHCLKGKEDNLFFVKHNDSQYRIEKIFIHPKFDRKNDEIYDAALVQLKDAIEIGKPALLYQGYNENGQAVIFVGRGTYGNGKDGLIRDDYKERGATNTVDMVNEHVIGFTFNPPPKSTVLEGISSRGDSGGPAFIELDDKLFVIGVSSYQVSKGYKEGHYGVGEYYTRVSSLYPWLKKVINNSPAPNIPNHPLITAILSNDKTALSQSINNEVLADKAIMREAFYQSVVLDRPELANHLIKSGADINSLTINKVSLFEFSLQQKRKQYFKMLQQLTSGLTDVHRKESRVLPLFIARFQDDKYLLQGVKTLLQQGANIDAQTHSGDTALIITGWSTNNFELFQLLVSYGANVNIPNSNGDTPLMDAAYLGKLENLEFLLDNGADTTLINKRGSTALQLAKLKKNQKAVSVLLKVKKAE
jgi:hypothetical protein